MIETRFTPFEDARKRALDRADLNAFISLADGPDPSVSEDGRLAGLVIAVKDNLHVTSLPNSAGTPALKNFIPANDAPIIQKLKSEGAQILGKTNMHELAFGITTVNTHFGNTLNPANTAYSPGGSSGGSAAAVAAGIVPIAIGGDTAASIRLPAALTGIIGYRPSPGRYPEGEATPLSLTRDVFGPMALSMQSITLLDSVLSNETEVTEPYPVKNLRLGIPKQFYADLDPIVEAAMVQTLSQLESAGVTLVNIDLGELPQIAASAGQAIVGYEARKDLSSYLKQYNTDVNFETLVAAIESPDVKSFYEQLANSPNGLVPEDTYAEIMKTIRPQLISKYQNLFEVNNIDALIFPTCITTAPLIQDDMRTVQHNGRNAEILEIYTRNTDLGSVIGAPGISLPVKIPPNVLPIGLELDGLPNDDRKLLAIALTISSLYGLSK